MYNIIYRQMNIIIKLDDVLDDILNVEKQDANDFNQVQRRYKSAPADLYSLSTSQKAIINHELPPVKKGPTQLKQEYIHFLDTKRNMIMEGEFTKILYTTPEVSIDGILIDFPIYIQTNPSSQSLDKYSNRNIIKFQPFHSTNAKIIQYFVVFENVLLDYYKQYKSIAKKSVYLLQNQLYNGSTKIYRNYITSVAPNERFSGDSRTMVSPNKMDDSPGLLARQNPKNKGYAIKISGVWESADSVGITYKILEII